MTQNPNSNQIQSMRGWGPAIRFASREVAKLGAHFISDRKPGDVAMYERGIGCERASKMLEEIALLIESQEPNETLRP